MRHSELLTVMKQLAATEAAVPEDVILDRWRLAKLLLLRRGLQDEEALLRAVADVYADFGYPADMRGAVYYMPVGVGALPRSATNSSRPSALWIG
jgi:hypothetical protein